MTMLVTLLMLAGPLAVLSSGETGEDKVVIATDAPIVIRKLADEMTPETLEALIFEVNELQLPLVTPTIPSTSPTPPPLQPTVLTDTETVVSAELTLASPLVGWPAGGQVTQGFGCTPYYTGLSGPGCSADSPWFHDGIDIAGSEGAPVRAALTGMVIFAETDPSGPTCGEWQGYGLVVIVDNGQGWQALYGHLARIEVVVGQALTPDSIIGTIGQTGCATGSHLHFGMNYQGVLVDPTLYVSE